MDQRIYEFNIHFKYINSKIDEFEKKYVKKHKLDVTKRALNYIAIIGNNKQLSVTQIVKRDSIAKSTFSNQIKALEEKGYIEFINHSKSDKRTKLLKLTNKGEAIYKVWREIREQFFSKYLSVLNPQELDNLWDLGLKVSNKLEQDFDRLEKK